MKMMKEDEYEDEKERRKEDEKRRRTDEKNNSDNNGNTFSGSISTFLNLNRCLCISLWIIVQILAIITSFIFFTYKYYK